MKGLLGLALLAQIAPQTPEEQIRRAVSVVETPAIREAAAPVEQWLGRALVVYEGGGNLGDLPVAVFPRSPEPSEALVTPTAVFVRKAQFTQFRSSFELAEFLSHAAAHVRLKHAERNANTNRAEMETEAEAMAAEILMTADCAPGPCAAFGRLLAAVRR